MWKKIINHKIFRFLICGAITAAFNVLVIAVMIEHFRLDTPVQRNIANLLSIEVSLIFSFFVYRIWVWSEGNWTIKEILWRQIPLYHFSCGTAVIIRSFILFPLLNWLGVNYSINTLIGITLGSILNYFMSDRLVFNNKMP